MSKEISGQFSNFSSFINMMTGGDLYYGRMSSLGKYKLAVGLMALSIPVYLIQSILCQPVESKNEKYLKYSKASFVAIGSATAALALGGIVGCATSIGIIVLVLVKVSLQLKRIPASSQTSRSKPPSAPAASRTSPPPAARVPPAAPVPAEAPAAPASSAPVTASASSPVVPPTSVQTSASTPTSTPPKSGSAEEFYLQCIHDQKNRTFSRQFKAPIIHKYDPSTGSTFTMMNHGEVVYNAEKRCFEKKTETDSSSAKPAAITGVLEFLNDGVFRVKGKRFLFPSDRNPMEWSGATVRLDKRTRDTYRMINVSALQPYGNIISLEMQSDRRYRELNTGIIVTPVK